MIDSHNQLLPVNSRVTVLVTGDLVPTLGTVAWRIEGEITNGDTTERYAVMQIRLDDGRVVGADQCEWWDTSGDVQVA